MTGLGAEQRQEKSGFEDQLQNAIYLNNFGVDGQVNFGRILQAVNSTVNATATGGVQPTKSRAKVFMTNLIYGITAFIGLVAFVLCCVAIYLLCTHCQQNRKVVIGGKEYYARPPSATGSETSRDLMGLTKSRDSELSNKNKRGVKVL